MYQIQCLPSSEVSDFNDDAATVEEIRARVVEEVQKGNRKLLKNCWQVNIRVRRQQLSALLKSH